MAVFHYFQLSRVHNQPVNQEEKEEPPLQVKGGGFGAWLQYFEEPASVLRFSLQARRLHQGDHQDS